MEDALRLRTLRLLTDYLEHCARRPGAAPQPPSTPEAAVLRALAAHIRQRYQFTWSRYRGYPGNRVELVASAVQDLHRICDALSWGHVVVLVTFAGILLERPPSDDTRRLEEWDASVGRDCRSLATLLCDWLAGQQRAWMEARGGWDGFCDFYKPVLPSSNRRLLVQVLLSCVTATILTYLWTKLL